VDLTKVFQHPVQKTKSGTNSAILQGKRLTGGVCNALYGTTGAGSERNIYRTAQCCGSGMFIPDPDFYPSRIQKQEQKRGIEKNLVSYLFCSHKFHKIENYFIFEMLKKKIWAN
jgi:hypothetical protein